MILLQQLTERGEERLGVPQEGLQDHRQREDSFEAPGGRLHLKIQNASGCHSGTYRCTVEELDGQRNQSGTVTLKVTGEVTCCTCLLLATCVCSCSRAPKPNPSAGV